MSFYAIQMDDTKGIQAYRLSLLPKGTISFETELESNVHAVITKVPRHHGSGVLTCKIQNDMKNVNFSLNDLQNRDAVYEVGDTLSGQIVQDKRSKRLRAKKLTFVECNPINRTNGKIRVIKKDFGFIRCCNHPTDAYFRLDDVMSKDQTSFREGSEVSFTLYTDESRNRAKRIQILPSLSVEWTVPLYVDVTGMIKVVPNRRHRKPRGQIEFSPPDSYLTCFPDLCQDLMAFEVDEARDEFTTSSKITESELVALKVHCNLKEWHWKYHQQRMVISKSSDSLSENAKTLKPCLVKFRPDALADARYVCKVNDKVKMNVMFKKRNQTLKAVLIHFDERPVLAPAPCPAPRLYQGVITCSKADYGFLHCVETNDSVYFSSNPDTALEYGDEVTFQISMNPKSGKPFASELMKLPPGTLEKPVVGDNVRGTIVKESYEVKLARKHFRKKEIRPGVIQLDGDLGTASFLKSNSNVLLRKHDIVTCALIKTIVPNTTYRSTKVELVESKAQTGMVESLTQYSGTIRPTLPGKEVEPSYELESPASLSQEVEEISLKPSVKATLEAHRSDLGDVDETLNGTDLSDLIQFDVKRVLDKSIKLNVGDVVEYGVFQHATTNRLTASSIVRLKVATESKSMPRPNQERRVNSSLKQMLRQSGAESRLAKGPDGSRGFNSGWRDPETPPPNDPPALLDGTNDQIVTDLPDLDISASVKAVCVSVNVHDQVVDLEDY